MGAVLISAIQGLFAYYRNVVRGIAIVLEVIHQRVVVITIKLEQGGINSVSRHWRILKAEFGKWHCFLIHTEYKLCHPPGPKHNVPNNIRAILG